MRFDISDRSFTAMAQQWIRSLDDDVLHDATAVFEASPGYYPSTLLGLWRAELQSRGFATAPLDVRTAVSAASLPVSHPADYEWRFSDTTAGLLIRTATTLIASGATVVHVGTPTTFAVGTTTYGQYLHVLMERSKAVTGALGSRSGPRDRIIPIDLGVEQAPRLGAAAAIVDPPWYPSDTMVFLTATARACGPGASILLCQPTTATRPGVSEEREALLTDLPGLGLVCTKIQAGVLRYRTPHFEAMSLRLAPGGAYIPADWRKGDLLILRKMAQVDHEESVTASEDVWSEAQFGPVRIKLRVSGEIDLGDLVSGDVLDNVSRRDPVRKCIGFWTSGNRAYTLAHPSVIGDFVDLCHTDFMASRFTVSQAAKHAETLCIPEPILRKLLDILLIELEEHILMREFYS